MKIQTLIYEGAPTAASRTPTGWHLEITHQGTAYQLLAYEAEKLQCCCAGCQIMGHHEWHSDDCLTGTKAAVWSLLTPGGQRFGDPAKQIGTMSYMLLLTWTNNHDELFALHEMYTMALNMQNQ